MYRPDEPMPHRTYRCPAEDFLTIKRAASAIGMSTHAFTRETLLERARRIIEATEVRLDGGDAAPAPDGRT